MNMNPQQIVRTIAWLAALGVVVIIATRVVGQVGAKASRAL